MSAATCRTHDVVLTFDERTVESVPEPLGPLGAERTYEVLRFVCPVDGCREREEVSR